MAEFLAAHKQVTQSEGGYSNDSADKGGETYQGISRRYHPTWKGWQIVDAHQPLEHGEIIDSTEMTSLVRQFYRVNFWDKIKADTWESQVLATFIYDWYINSGVIAIKKLQSCLNIMPDGVIGPVSIQAINDADEGKLLGKLKQSRIDFYRSIVANDASQKKFLRGWLNRVDMLS